MALLFSSVTFPNSSDDDYSLLRLTFNQDIKDDSPWDISKFRIIPLTGGVEPHVLSVETPLLITDVIDLTIGTMTSESGSNSYKAWVESGYISNDLETETLDSPNNEELFTGQGVDFTVEKIEALSIASLRLTFNRRVLLNSDLLDPIRYTFTNGLQCLGVILSSTNSVDLVTTTQIAGTNYQLSVSAS